MTPDENDIVYEGYGLDLAGIIRALIEAILNFFGSGDGASSANTFFDTLSFWWNVYSIFAILVSLLLFVGFIYAKIRFAQLFDMQLGLLAEAEKAWEHAYGGGATVKNKRWEDIQNHVLSENPNDWRLAIIEADILLDEALTQAGYVGASIGDKLKTVNTNAVASLRDAWDAHMVRNQIAHVGADFVLTRRIAQETIVKFERILKEFGTI